jgi:hypothetical protein
MSKFQDKLIVLNLFSAKKKEQEMFQSVKLLPNLLKMKKETKNILFQCK